MEIKQYDIVWVNLNPTIGSEINKVGSAVVISPNEMNEFLNTIIIAPITSSLKAYPTRIAITYPKIKGYIVADQIRTIDKQRITKKVAVLNSNEIIKLKTVIKEIFID